MEPTTMDKLNGKVVFKCQNTIHKPFEIYVY